MTIPKNSPLLLLLPTIILPFLFLVPVLMTGCQDQKAAGSSKEPAQAVSTAATESSAFPGVVCLKAGLSTPFTESSGKVWLPERGFDGAETIEREPGTAIFGASDLALFLSGHNGVNSFSCKVPDGKYTAKLYFAETFGGIRGLSDHVFAFNVPGHESRDFDVG